MDSSPPPKHADLLPPSTTTAATAATKTTPLSLSSSMSMAGTKRPAPSLLPPFEPFSSSPGFPRPLKRQARAGSVGSIAHLKYPTPVPTSSTGILSSSPPRASQNRPGLLRTQSLVSERAPLASVPSIELNENGETLLMGRSSNSSHYQLSGNRLVSRVHVKARYVPAATLLDPNKIEIICNGWNGLKLHCQGRTWELHKGDSFTSEKEGTDIMLDVHDARLMVQWPKRDHRETPGNLSDSSWDDSPRSQGRGGGVSGVGLLQSSPLRRSTRIETPESPTPGANMSSSSQRLESLLPGADSGEIEIFEDPSSGEASPVHELPGADIGQSFATDVTNPFSSDLSDLEDGYDENDDGENQDEENDPIVHSFGPFGANLSNRLASITASSPKYKNNTPSPQRPKRVHLTASDPDLTRPNAAILDAAREEEEAKKREATAAALAAVKPAVKNHVINQLAFSRLSSTPLSAIMNNLPSEEKEGLTKDVLRIVIEETVCIGTIARQGKDAGGKPLESEYYYIPEADDDEQRRVAVTDGLRKPSLRACRKQHKQYYWKRPKTP